MSNLCVKMGFYTYSDAAISDVKAYLYFTLAKIVSNEVFYPLSGGNEYM